VGPREFLDTVEKIKKFKPLPGIKFWAFSQQPVAMVTELPRLH
jgi:hypothetical protein